MKRISIAVFIAITLSLILFNLFPASRSAAMPGAQSTEQPVNLSHSGTASQPRILALPNGRARVFWVDRFDGMMTATFDGQAWSNPQKTAIPLYGNASSMPVFFLDSLGWINAFWLAPEENKDTGSVLMYSQIGFEKMEWSQPQTVARYVLAFDVSETKYGLVVAYIQGQIFGNYAPGVYIRQNYGMNSPFLSPKSILIDHYYRALTPDKARVHIAASQGEDGGVYLDWVGSRNGEILFSASVDQAKSWSDAAPVETPATGASFTPPYMMLSSDAQGLFLLWQTGGEGNCAIYQQKAALGSSGVQFAGANKVSQLTSDCPQNDHVWSGQGGGLWLWGEGTNKLSLLRWGNQEGQWADPSSITYEAPNEDAQNQALHDLHASLAGDYLMAVGVGSVVQDVWFQRTPIQSFVSSTQETSAWADPNRIDVTGQVGDLSVGIGTDGTTHTVWSQKQSSTANAASLYYAQVSQGKTSRTVEIVKSSQGSANPHPSLLVRRMKGTDIDHLHLVWSGGQNGGIQYAQALAQEGLSSAAWTSPELISADAPAVWPQIVSGSAGYLYVLYVVPLNENRGVYLTYSADDGKNWSEPIQIFDAVKAGWQMVDHPTLAISTDGVLHAAWVQRPLPDMGQPLGIYYARSLDGGQTWSAPVSVTDESYDWPTLISTQDRVHLIYLQTATGNLFQRFLTVADVSASTNPRWSVAFNILNYLSISRFDNQVKPYSLSASAKSLYLIGSSQVSQDFIYSTCTQAQGSQAGEMSWSTAETVNLPLEGDAQVVSKTRGSLSSQSGMAVIAFLEEVRAGSSDGGASRFDVVISSRSVTADGDLSVISRQPTKVAAVSASQPDPTMAPTQAAPVTGTPVVTVTPKPVFSNSTQGKSLPVLPPVLGGILAAAAIVIALAFRVFWTRKQP